MEGMDEAVQADLQVNPKEATSKNARKIELIGNKQREEERKRKEEERARKRGTTQFFDRGYAAKFRGLANGEHVKDVTISLAGRVISKPSSSSKLFLYDMYGDDTTIKVVADARNPDIEEEGFATLHSTVRRGDIIRGLIDPNCP